MSTKQAASTDRPTGPSERFWPLDLAIASLAGLILYLIVAQLKFDDPRWLHNGWTYVIAVPVIAFLLAIISHAVASKYVQKSLQLGFLFSIFVHLLLLILAINVVIFRSYFPDALAGIKQARTPINRTIPEYIFRSPSETASTPDWSRPIEAETTSRVTPAEKRQIPPVEYTAPKMEVPRPKDLEQRPMQKFLAKRKTPSKSLPQPARSPGQLARPRTIENSKSTPWSPNNPTAPNVRAERSTRPAMTEQALDEPAARKTLTERRTVASAAPRDLPNNLNRSDSANAARTNAQPMPEINVAQARQRRPRSVQRKMMAAGASPTTSSVAIERVSESADRMLETFDAAPVATAKTRGADLTLNGEIDSTLTPLDTREVAPIAAARQQTQGSDLPAVARGNTRDRSVTVSGRSGRSQEFLPAGAPSETTGRIAAAALDSISDQQISDRMAESDSGRRTGPPGQGQPSSPATSDIGQAGPTLDLLLDDGPVGMATKFDRNSGIVPGESIPEVAALELSPGLQRRRHLGGPVTPFGTKVAAVESFSRRVKRTDGGAAPSPAGAVGPATEKAIERGLAYLASVQNEDGSWSLQGQGSEVVLRSDTAATGLCLLAFQGAGYTHRQHQYADTISRGLEFLLDNQRTSGDLYRREDRISNDNVALYSHGIAALALCEAYGMTQDPELKTPAQLSIRYIAESQHVRRGGWRYTPQVSSDTSVTGWMMMALKSGQLSGLDVPEETYRRIERWLDQAQGPKGRKDRYRYNPYAPNTAAQRHGRIPTPTMTAVGMLMRMYTGWRRDNDAMQSAADYLLEHPPQMGSTRSPKRDGYYWYYATMVMFHMGGDHWKQWNQKLKSVLLASQITEGEASGSWDPIQPVPDRWSAQAGRIYVTTMNLLNLEVYYRHLPIYDDSAE